MGFFDRAAGMLKLFIGCLNTGFLCWKKLGQWRNYGPHIASKTCLGDVKDP